MRLFSVIIALELVCSWGWAQPAPADSVPSINELKVTLKKLLTDLDKMKRENAANPDKGSRAKVQESLERAITRIRAVLEAKAATIAIRSKDFALLMERLRQEKDDAKRLNRLQLLVGANWFKCNQAVTLVSLFPKKEHKINVAKLLWPRLVDPSKHAVLLHSVGDKRAQAQLKKQINFKQQ